MVDRLWMSGAAKRCDAIIEPSPCLRVRLAKLLASPETLACCSTGRPAGPPATRRSLLGRRAEGERLAVADDQDAVVQGGAAGRVKDAARVQLELALVRLDGHADGLVGGRLRSHRAYQSVHDRRGSPWQMPDTPLQSTCHCLSCAMPFEHVVAYRTFADDACLKPVLQAYCLQRMHRWDYLKGQGITSNLQQRVHNLSGVEQLAFLRALSSFGGTSS